MSSIVDSIIAVFKKVSDAINNAANESRDFSQGLRNFKDRTHVNNLTPEMTYFNDQLFKYFYPDINGYVLIFMVPPQFDLLTTYMNHENIEFMSDFMKLVVFTATDFTPPQVQVSSEAVISRVGAVPYATEVHPSEQCSITFIDNQNLDVYRFHYTWVEFMKELVEGIIPVWGPSDGQTHRFHGKSYASNELPGEDYMKYESNNQALNDLYGALDYAASAYIVKYDPTMKHMQFVGKATGIFPQSLPSKELIGQRTANEITTLPFTYFCAYYEEAMDSHHIIWKELENFLKLYYL